MDRTDKDLYTKVLAITTAFTTLLRLENNEDDSVGNAARYNALAHTIASKITSKNNTEFVLISDKSGVELSIKIGSVLRVKKIKIKNFNLVYDENN